jgi:hypothetical protein
MPIAVRSPDSRLVQSRRLPGPPLALGVVIAMAATAFVVGAQTLAPALLLPLVATLLFVLAAATALFASLRREPFKRRAMTYWDVAGLLTLIGVFATAAVEPDHLVALVEGTRQGR